MTGSTPDVNAILRYEEEQYGIEMIEKYEKNMPIIHIPIIG